MNQFKQNFETIRPEVTCVFCCSDVQEQSDRNAALVVCLATFFRHVGVSSQKSNALEKTGSFMMKEKRFKRDKSYKKVRIITLPLSSIIAHKPCNKCSSFFRVSRRTTTCSCRCSTSLQPCVTCVKVFCGVSVSRDFSATVSKPLSISLSNIFHNCIVNKTPSRVAFVVTSMRG